jgi:hypothetical protein
MYRALFVAFMVSSWGHLAVAAEPAVPPPVGAAAPSAGGFGPELGGFQLGMTAAEFRRAAAGKLGLGVEAFEAGVENGTIPENVYKEYVGQLPRGSATVTVCVDQDRAKVPDADRLAPCRFAPTGKLWKQTSNPVLGLSRIDLHTEVRVRRLVPKRGGGEEEQEFPESSIWVQANFSGLPGAERLISLRREQSFVRDDRKPTGKASLAALVEKLGAPLWCDRFPKLAGGGEYRLRGVYQEALGQAGCYWRPRGSPAGRSSALVHPMLALAICRGATGLVGANGGLARAVASEFIQRRVKVPTAAGPSAALTPESFTAWLVALRNGTGLQEVPLLDLCGEALVWAPGLVDEPEAEGVLVSTLAVQAGWFRGGLEAREQVKRHMDGIEAEAKRRLEAARQKGIEGNKNRPDL